MQADAPHPENPVADALRGALQRQHSAYLAHPVPSLAERRADLQQLARFVQDNRQAILAAISADFGHRSTHETLMLEFTPFLAGIRQCLQHVKRWMRPQRRHIERLTYGLARNEVIPQPLGVVGVIVPWNFPLLLSMVPLANIFAAGNRAIVKMSENSRHLAALLIEQSPKYFPPEKLQFFDETGGVGFEFSKLPFDHLIFTGSGQTGRAVMAAAAQNLCPVTLELGGKAPAVVCDDFELEVAAERILFAKFTSAGQICTTADHAYLPEGKIAAFVDLARDIVVRRYGTLASPDYTSIISRASYERLVGALDEARARGARVIPLLPGAPFDEARRTAAKKLAVFAAMLDNTVFIVMSDNGADAFDLSQLNLPMKLWCRAKGALGFEDSGGEAIFMGDHKLMRNGPPFGDGTWRLINLHDDPTESTDLSALERERSQKAVATSEAYHQRTGVVLPEAGYNPVRQLLVNNWQVLARQMWFLLLPVGLIVLGLPLLLWWWVRRRRSVGTAGLARAA